MRTMPSCVCVCVCVCVVYLVKGFPNGIDQIRALEEFSLFRVFRIRLFCLGFGCGFALAPLRSGCTVGLVGCCVVVFAFGAHGGVVSQGYKQMCVYTAKSDLARVYTSRYTRLGVHTTRMCECHV